MGRIPSARCIMYISMLEEGSGTCSSKSAPGQLVLNSSTSPLNFCVDDPTPSLEGRRPQTIHVEADHCSKEETHLEPEN